MFSFSSTAIPFTRQSFADWSLSHKSDANKAALDAIYARYKMEINQASKLTNVPTQIITSIIFIESGGDANASNGGTFGLMQILPDAMVDVLVMVNKKGNLTQVEKDALRNTLGNRLDAVLKMKYPGDAPMSKGKYSPPLITKDDLMKSPFNILCGSIYLGLLIGEETTNGTTRLDRVVARYNLGYYSKLPKLSTEALLADKTIRDTTKNYILKFVGKNGTLDQFV